ncbi:MAG: oxidoreductase [Actinobacteria bacterium HGW-Actinobacteria-4]|nr:MAG: oxidoreductase [Actinobacteria bacterium HGW-Actinobacteria-4]
MSRGWNRRIGQTSLFTSTIIAGASPLGSMPNLYGYEVSELAAVDFVLALLRSPIRAIDTSNNYGNGASERRIGQAIELAGGVPEDFSVITKVDSAGADFSGNRVRESFRESLERLGVQRVPLLFLHDPDAFDFGYMTSPGGAVDALVQIRDEGLADAIGIATGDTWLLHQYLDLGVFDVILSHNRFTLVDRSADELFSRAVTLGVGVLNAAVYGGGILARPGASTKYSYRSASPELLEAIAAMSAVCTKHGIDLATAALQFSLRDPRIDATVVGITSEPRIASLIASAGTHIPDGVWDELEQLVPPASTWLDAPSRGGAS